MRANRSLWRVAACCAALAAVAALAAEPAKVEVRDDFAAYKDGSDGSPAWTPYLGKWVVRGGQCEQTDAATRGAHLFRPEPLLGDLDFSVRFKPLAGGEGVRAAGMIFRARDNLNFYYAHLDSRNSQVILIRSTTYRGWRELARVPRVRIAPGQWHTGRVVCTGDLLQVHLDGKLVAEARDRTFPAGAVGLRCGQGHVVFDDVVLTGTPPAKAGAFAMKEDPKDESSVPRLEGVHDQPAVTGQGYFPVLVMLKDGSLGAVVRGGDAHIGIKGRLDWIHSADGGKTWSKPTVIVDSQWDDRNPGAGVMPDGTIVVSYGEAHTYNAEGKWDRTAGKYVLYYVLSTDGGKTWSKKIALCPDLLHNGSPFGRIIALRDGTALMQVYTWKTQSKEPVTAKLKFKRPCVGILRSTDNGRTWGDWSLVATGANEIALVEMPDGRLVAAMRSSGVSVCESADKGRTWSKPQAVTKTGEIPPDLWLLRSGALLMVYGCRLEPKGAQAILSDDAGKTWGFDKRVFVAWKALSSDCGYPSVVQLADGTIVMLYYAVGTLDLPGRQCRCVRFTEDALRKAMK